MYLHFKPLRLSITRCLALLSLIALSGCGGSSGDSEPTAAIDSGNATAIARAAISSALDLEEVGELGALDDLGMLDTTSQSALNKSSRIALRAITGSQTEQCLVSGSVIFSVDIESTDSLSAGDVITLNANLCDNGDNAIIDGQMQVTINEFTDDFIDIGVQFTNLSVTEFDEVAILNGDVSITLAMTETTMQITLSGNSLTVSSMGETQSFSNFSNSYTVDASSSPLILTYDCWGNISSSEFQGTVNYQLSFTFTGSADNNPDSGELLITGANNATLSLTTIDGVIQIDADYNGDGVIDETLEMAWAEVVE